MNHISLCTKKGIESKKKQHTIDSFTRYRITDFYFFGKNIKTKIVATTAVNQKRRTEKDREKKNRKKYYIKIIFLMQRLYKQI